MCAFADHRQIAAKINSASILYTHITFSKNIIFLITVTRTATSPQGCIFVRALPISNKISKRKGYSISDKHRAEKNENPKKSNFEFRINSIYLKTVRTRKTTPHHLKNQFRESFSPLPKISLAFVCYVNTAYVQAVSFTIDLVDSVINAKLI